MAKTGQAKEIIENRRGDTFVGWPARTLLEAGDIPIVQIAELALREGQSSNPLYRVHRWFARRVGSQFRSIITALTLPPDKADAFWDTYLGKTSVHGAVVLDPFIGGGTSLVESMRCNARVVGFDIDPVATFITRFELDASRMEDHYPEIEQICNEVAQLIAPLHRTMVDGVERDVLHHFLGPGEAVLELPERCRAPSPFSTGLLQKEGPAVGILQGLSCGPRIAD